MTWRWRRRQNWLFWRWWRDLHGFKLILNVHHNYENLRRWIREIKISLIVLHLTDRLNIEKTQVLCVWGSFKAVWANSVVHAERGNDPTFQRKAQEIFWFSSFLLCHSLQRRGKDFKNLLKKFYLRHCAFFPKLHERQLRRCGYLEDTEIWGKKMP